VSIRLAALSLALLAAACGGGAAPTRTPTPATLRPATAAPTTTSADAALCVLTAQDWQQFNYVTTANPNVAPDQPEGTAICQYASNLFLEMYTHDNEADAAATLETIRQEAPFDGDQTVTLPGADVARYDADVGDNHAGIVVQAGKLTFVIYGLARDSSQAELTTLAGLVLTRSQSVQ
jgi:hypothetical protein